MVGELMVASRPVIVYRRTWDIDVNIFNFPYELIKGKLDAGDVYVVVQTDHRFSLILYKDGISWLANSWN